MNAKTLWAVVVLVVVIILAWLSNQDSQLVSEVKSGEVSLQCHLDSGYVRIDPAMVVDFYADQGYWKFTNGGSKSCQVVR